MVTKRIVTPDDLEHLPTEIHRRIAKQLIISGEWRLYTTTSGNQGNSKAGMD